MANIIYRLSAREVNGKNEILLRFYHGRTEQRAHSHVYVPAHLWDDKAQHMVVNKRYVTSDTIIAQELQSKLDDISSAIMSRFIGTQIITDGWLQKVVDEVMMPGARGEKRMIKLQDACAEYAEQEHLEKSTKAAYNVLSRQIAEFSRLHYTIYVNTITIQDIEELQRFFRRGLNGTCSHNTVVSRMRKLRAVVRAAVKNGLCEKNPFGDGGFSVGSEVYGTPAVLTMQEVEQIYATPMTSKRLEMQRDVFVFHCYVGCRVSDLVRLTDKNIINTDAGIFLQYIQQKTRKITPRTTEVPLSNTAVEILEKYKGTLKKGMILPLISEQKYNDYIKEVLRIAGIDRKVPILNTQTFTDEYLPICEIASTHLARRTFVSNIYAITQEERLTISMSGHAEGSRALSRYIHINDTTKRSVIDKLGKSRQFADLTLH